MTRWSHYRVLVAILTVRLTSRFVSFLGRTVVDADSGSYIRGGREMAASAWRAQNRLREDQGQAMMGSYLQDQLDLGIWLSCGRTASQNYQNLVASLYGNQMRGA